MLSRSLQNCSTKDKENKVGNQGPECGLGVLGGFYLGSWIAGIGATPHQGKDVASEEHL